MSTAAQRATAQAEQGAAEHRAATELTPAEMYAIELADNLAMGGSMLTARRGALACTLAYFVNVLADDAAIGAAVRQLWDAYIEVAS